MNKPLREFDQIVPSDGTIRVPDLKPGVKVHVVVTDSAPAAAPDSPASPFGPPNEYGGRIYRPDLPRTQPGSLEGSIGRYIDPFEPATDPDDWNANR